MGKVTIAMKIKRIISRLLPDFIKNRLEYLLHSKYIKKGKRGGKKVYILSVSSFRRGVLCMYMHALSEIPELKKRGHIVAIDYEDSISINTENIGRENLWDTVFEQPCGISVAEALRMDTVVLVTRMTHLNNVFRMQKKYDKQYYKEKNKLYCDTFAIKKELQTAWNTDFSAMFSGKRVLGVTLRETFRLMHENNAGWSEKHPNEPDTNEVIEIIKTNLKECNCEYVFLTTEYSDSLEALSAVFGDKLLYTDRRRKYITQEYIGDIIRGQSGDCSDEEINEILKRDADGGRAQKNREYVKEVYGLSKCTCLLGTPSNGMRTALLWNAGEYENVSFFGDKSFESGCYF